MTNYDVYAGVDVGKSFHWIYATDADGKRIISRKINQNETELQEMFTSLRAGERNVLVVVDQPKNIGALTLACAKQAGCHTMFLPGLAMRRAAGILPGEAKTDARDAEVISMAARQIPASLRPVSTADPERAELDALVAWDSDVVHDRTREINRLRGLLVEVNPHFEAAIDDLTSPFILAIIQRFGGPWGMRTAGKTKIRAWASRQKHVPAATLETLIETAWTMENKPPGTTTREAGPIPAAAARISELTTIRDNIETQISQRMENNITYQMLMTMPGVGIHTASSLVTLVDITLFKNADHLASYAGIAPKTHDSGTSIKGETASRAGNKALKNTLFMSAFTSLKADPKSRAYYDTKRAAGKKHNTAVLSLARRRIKIMYAIMRDNTPYHT